MDKTQDIVGLKRPAWWVGDFDTTGKTQLGSAKDAAAAYRAAHLERYGGVPSVTPSVTEAGSVTNVALSKGELRVKKWRERKRSQD